MSRFTDEYLKRLEESIGKVGWCHGGEARDLIAEVRRLHYKVDVAERAFEIQRDELREVTAYLSKLQDPNVSGVRPPMLPRRPTGGLSLVEWAMIFGLMLGFAAGMVLLFSMERC